MITDLDGLDGGGSIFLFPGQGLSPYGALTPRRLGPVPRSCRNQVDQVIEQVDQVAAEHGYGGVREVLLGIGQPGALPYGLPPLAHFATSVAVARALEITPDRIVGHSLGEFAALVYAGAFTLAEGAALVCALNDAYRPALGRGDLVIVHAGETETRALLAAAGRPDLAIACVNSPRQTILSGSHAAIAALLDRTGTPRMSKLAVGYEAHHAGLNDVRARFLNRVGDFRLRQGPLRMPVLSPVQRRAHRETDHLVGALADCITKPVLFSEVLEGLRPAGQAVFIELGVGDNLARCAAATLPGMRTLSPLAGGDGEA